MKKTSTVRVNGNMIFKGHKLTIGVDLGDRWSNYCVLDEAGEVLLEQKVATTPEGMKQTFEKIPRSLIALETGTHSPWVSRLLKELGHEVLVAHAQKVNLITKSTRKDRGVKNRLDGHKFVKSAHKTIVFVKTARRLSPHCFSCLRARPMCLPRSL